MRENVSETDAKNSRNKGKETQGLVAKCSKKQRWTVWSHDLGLNHGQCMTDRENDGGDNGRPGGHLLHPAV